MGKEEQHNRRAKQRNGFDLDKIIRGIEDSKKPRMPVTVLYTPGLEKVWQDIVEAVADKAARETMIYDDGETAINAKGERVDRE